MCTCMQTPVVKGQAKKTRAVGAKKEAQCADRTRWDEVRDRVVTLSQLAERLGHAERLS